MSKNVLRLFAAICSYTKSLEIERLAERTDSGDGPRIRTGPWAPRSRPASASKYSRVVKLNMPAMMFDGIDWILLLYFTTLSL